MIKRDSPLMNGGNVRLISLYLKKNRFGILFCFGVYLIMLIVFILYRLPLKALAYPFILSGAFAFVASLMQFSRTLKKHRELERIQAMSSEMLLELPEAEDMVEGDYQNIVLALDQELRRIQEQSLENRKDMMEYYSAWVHQIKIPISSMRLALENEDSPLERRLDSDLLRIEQYVEMVLTYLRLESSSTDYVFEECDLDSVIRQSIAKFSTEFIGRRIGLDYSPVNKRIITDEKWLSLVVEQILSNALKYTRSGSVKIYAEDDWLVFKDTGIGIAPEDLPRVFERGYTGYNGRYDKKASGIGLYLCKRICDNLKINIIVDSVVGEGTGVRLDLRQRRMSLE